LELADKIIVGNMCIGILILSLIAIALSVFETILGSLIYIATREEAGLFAILAGVLGLVGVFLISAF